MTMMEVMEVNHANNQQFFLRNGWIDCNAYSNNSLKDIRMDKTDFYLFKLIYRNMAIQRSQKQ